MEINKSLEYRICFDKVENLDKHKGKSDFYGSVKVENYLYAITIDENSKKKELAKEIIPNIISSFREVFYSTSRKKGKPLKYFDTYKEITNGKVINAVCSDIVSRNHSSSLK